jgi:heme exporter protein A
MTLQGYQLACVRGERELFADLNFDIEEGDALWLVGANGSGKTSLLRLLCGLASPQAGEVRWNGHDIRSVREEFQRNLIYCGHASGVKDDLTAWENVAIGSRLAGRRCSREEADRALDQAGLAHVARVPAGVLSQGQRKRIALARLCLLPTSKLLILDEPSSALDRHALQLLCDILDLHLARGGMAVYTTHQELALKTRRLHLLDMSQPISC